MCCFDGLGLDIGRRGQCGACRRSVMCDARCKMHTMAAIWSKIEDNARGHGFRQGQGHGYGYTVPITTVPSFETKQSKVRSSESTLPQRPTQLHDLPSTFPNFESALPRFRSLDQLMRAVQMSESGHSDMQSASGALYVTTEYVSDRRVRGFRSLGRTGTVFVLDISLQIPRNGGCSVSTGSSHAFDL